MSYDFAVWKRSPTAKTAMLAAVYESISNDRDHPAMAPFDMPALIEALEKEFGQVNGEPDGPFLYSVGNGSTANWLHVNCNYSQTQQITDRLATIAVQQGLLVYDPQQGAVRGNRRPTMP